MTIRLGSNRYGKSDVRLVKVRRGTAPGDRHEVADLTLDLRVEGDFAAAHTAGDNALVVPTDTMKNTVYALARQDAVASPESFALRLARHLVATYPQVEVAEVAAVERRWDRLPGPGGGQPHAFVAAGDERRHATARVERGGATSLVSGISGLLILKTSQSAFSGFPRDGFTTLRETEDRLLATVVEADWRWRDPEPAPPLRDRVRALMLAAFAAHDSRSVQHTLHAMGEAVLDGVPEVESIHLLLPNVHHILADLAPFGLDNPNDVFVATGAPYGRIEATVERG